MQVSFVDREEELKLLNELWLRGKPEFVVVYGRRRVGKTRLIMEFIKDKPHVYFQCLPVSDEVNLRRLARVAGKALGLRELLGASFSGLDSLLSYITRAYGGRLAVILDEFTYWARYSPKVVGELQSFIDHVLPETNLMLILCGSLVGVMHRNIIGYGAPLYGRRTASLRLKELKPWHVKHFLKIKDKADRLRVYALVGGMPFYLTYVAGSESLEEVLTKLFCSKLSPIYDEPHTLFREEFRNPELYYSIVAAIAAGHNRLTEIANYTGIQRTHLPKYLRILSDLGIIAHVTPIMGKKGWYEVRDPILRTWFKLVEPNLSLVEAGLYDELLTKIKVELDQEVAPKAFEEVVRTYVLREFLPTLARLRSKVAVGRYVHRGVEFDLVVLHSTSGKACVFEVKWSDLTEKDVRREYSRLLHKVKSSALSKYDVKAYIVARSAPSVDGANILTLKDLPI